MNARTRDELVETLECLRTVALNLPTQGAGELTDQCTEAIAALIKDETIIEPR